MTTHAREIEFKFAVENRQAFNRLLDYLNLPETLLDEGITQTNHFFDSDALCLHADHFVIRLRQQGDKNILTIKGESQPDKNADSILTNRIEEEAELTPETARALLRGSITPRQVIEMAFEHQSSSILQLIESACHEKTLAHIGKFRNVRIHLPPVNLSLGDTDTEVEFELDSSTFPDGSVEYELEVEITEYSDAVKIESALVSLLGQAGIEWHSAPSKAKRFFNSLAR